MHSSYSWEIFEITKKLTNLWENWLERNVADKDRTETLKREKDKINSLMQINFKTD